MFLKHPGSRKCSSNQSSIPTKASAAENEIKRRLCEALPFFQNEKQPRAEQSRDGGSEDGTRRNLWIIAIPFQFQTENPDCGQSSESPEKTEAVDSHRANLKEHGIHRR